MWVGLDKEMQAAVDSVVDEIEDAKSDRAIAVIAAAFVEEHLTRFMKERLVRSEATVERLFKPGGALGDFGLKVDLGLLIGLYPEKIKQELNWITKVRNQFAHKLEINSFDNHKVAAIIGNLKLIESDEMIITIENAIKGHKGEGNSATIFPRGRDGEKLTSRDRYVASCQWHIMRLSMYRAGSRLEAAKRASWPQESQRLRIRARLSSKETKGKP